MKQVLINISLVIALILGVTALGFYSGIIGNVYDSTISKKHMDIERDNFKHSKSYVEGQIQDLSSYKREYDRAKSPEEKKQILNFVDNDFANFDETLIESSSLKDFLQKARGGF